MSLPWLQRKQRLASLLKSQGDEDEDGLALDRILHGQSVIGKTCQSPAIGIGRVNSLKNHQTSARTTEIDALRFQDKDLSAVGTLEYGQFGVVCLVCSISPRQSTMTFFPVDIRRDLPPRWTSLCAQIHRQTICTTEP